MNGNSQEETDPLNSLALTVVAAMIAERRVVLHRRALWLEYFTVGWNVIEAVVAIAAGVGAGSVALIAFGVTRQSR
jgi:hypothetical protein